MKKHHGQSGNTGRYLWGCLLALLYPAGLSAQAVIRDTARQEVLVSAGGSAMGTLGRGGAGCTVYWSVGEPVVETYAGSKKVLTQGFWQADGYIRDTVEMDTAWLDLGLEAVRLAELVCFPNPTDGPLRLQLRRMTDVSMAAELWLSDGQGRVLCRKAVRDWPWQGTMDLSAYPAGVYVLTLSLRPWNGAGGVEPAERRLKSYKIIKY